MPSSGFDRFVALSSLISLVHCAYSAAQHRFYLRLVEQPFEGLPLDILIQTLVSLVVLIWSAGNVAGTFQPIKSHLQQRGKRWDETGACLSFALFDHRAKALSPGYHELRRHAQEDFTAGTSEEL